MAHSSVILDKRSQKKDGTFPIKIRVSHKGDFYISVGIDVFDTQWQETADTSSLKAKTGIVVNHKQAATYNNLITARKLEIDKMLVALIENRKILKMDKKHLQEYLLEDQGPGVYLFKTHYEKYNAVKSRPGTLDTLKNTYSNIAKFADIETLNFSQMNYSWVKEFDQFMAARDLSVNGRAVYMRNLRAIFNDAIKCDYVSLADYPFRKFKIKSEPTMKRSLTIDDLRKLRDYPITEIQEHQKKYRDMFMLIFYLIGINAVDLFGAKDAKNGRLEFRRAKTGRLYSIKIEPEAVAIIEKYAGENYLLDVCDNYGNYQDFLHRMNKNLKEIGEMEMVANAAKIEKERKRNKKSITPLFPALSSYWARHTWATIAADLDIPDETISLALGHAGANSTTNIYINRNQRKVDDANRKVIDFVSSSVAASDYLEHLATEALAKATESAAKKSVE